MVSDLQVNIDAWKNGDNIPGIYGICVPVSEGHVTHGRNINPRIDRAYSGPSGGNILPGTFVLSGIQPVIPDEKK